MCEKMNIQYRQLSNEWDESDKKYKKYSGGKYGFE